MSIIIRVLPCKPPLFIVQISSPSAQLQLSPSPSLQPSISPENGNFDSDTDLQFFDPPEVLLNDRRFFIYNFGRDTDDAAENGDFGGETAEDEASEDAVDGKTVSH